MAIKKQEFYEGAALHILARTGAVAGIRYAPPFFHLNDHLHIRLKYSTRSRSPWGFTFGHEEQELLHRESSSIQIVLALVCGADGVAAITYDEYLSVASPRKSAIRIACHRRHGEHYEVSGPDGSLSSKVAPSRWPRILNR